ncbi:MAG: DinB family protein, partial [Bryobacteraceae bacterium]
MTIAPEKTARLHQINAARIHTDALFRMLQQGALYERPIPERHRLIFYTGHLEAFDWNLIGRRSLGLPAFHPSFDKLFEFGIDPEPGKAAADQPSDWPSVHEIEKYNRRVREAIDRDIDAIPEEIFHTSLEHRWMHAETISYLFHSLPYSAKVPAD